jgi:hypothetical protein
VFKNRVLRKIPGPKRGEVTGQRRLYNEELYDLQPSANIIRVIKKNEIDGACGMYGGKERCIQGFGVKT